MTGWVNVCWSMGGFIATGVTTGTNQIQSNYVSFISNGIAAAHIADASISIKVFPHTVYDPMFVLPRPRCIIISSILTRFVPGTWPIPLLIAMWFAPESPWWLVRHGKLAEAERSVRMLSTAEAAERAPEQVANMVRVTKLEQEEAQAIGNSGWLELFRGTDLRRTEITCVAWIGRSLLSASVLCIESCLLILKSVQNACGVIFAGSTTYVFEQAGFPQSEAFNLGLGASAIHFLANFVNL